MGTLLFLVTEGEVTVILSASQFVVSRGDSFFVPPHNTYNLMNFPVFVLNCSWSNTDIRAASREIRTPVGSERGMNSWIQREDGAYERGVGSLNLISADQVQTC